MVLLFQVKFKSLVCRFNLQLVVWFQIATNWTQLVSPSPHEKRESPSLVIRKT